MTYLASMANTIELRLTGGEAELGQIPAADVARLILGAEKVLARAARHVVGRPKGSQGGRRGKVIESAVRLRLVGISEGSVRVLLAPPTHKATGLDLGLDVASLTVEAIQVAGRVMSEPSEPAHRDVARDLVRLSDDLGLGTRYRELTWVHSALTHETARLDATASERLRVAADLKPPAREDQLTGRLVEADFERHSARLRTPAGGRVDVTFGQEWDALIQEALRSDAVLAGEVVYDPETSLAKSVHLRRLEHAEQLQAGLLPGEFKKTVAVDQLARETGIQAFDPGSAVLDITDAEADAFLAALAE
jgi:hypothetical protein